MREPLGFKGLVILILFLLIPWLLLILILEWVYKVLR